MAYAAVLIILPVIWPCKFKISMGGDGGICVSGVGAGASGREGVYAVGCTFGVSVR